MKRWEYIVDKHPNLYKRGMAFECGIGWYDIINDLSDKLEPLAESRGNQIGEYVFAEQVKEKFGTLRFYLSCATDDMYKLIDEAEWLSQNTCEACGKPGILGGDKWMAVRCDLCRG